MRNQPNDVERQSRIEIAARVLKRRYHDFAHYNRKNAFEELLFIICSVQTQESNYRRTFRALRHAFPRFSDLAAASIAEIEKPLVSGGLYRNKARAIRALCDRILERHGHLSLARLKDLDDADCEAFLTSLPGVGLKVARCVMLYSFGRQVFPVDTHCWRICRRLGWVRASSKDGECTREDMERLQKIIPGPWRFSIHVNFISLGRAVCTAKNPKCEICPVAKICRHGLRQGNSGRGASVVQIGRHGGRHSAFN